MPTASIVPGTSQAALQPDFDLAIATLVYNAQATRARVIQDRLTEAMEEARHRVDDIRILTQIKSEVGAVRPANTSDTVDLSRTSLSISRAFLGQAKPDFVTTYQNTVDKIHAMETLRDYLEGVIDHFTPPNVPPGYADYVRSFQRYGSTDNFYATATPYPFPDPSRSLDMVNADITKATADNNALKPRVDQYNSGSDEITFSLLDACRLAGVTVPNNGVLKQGQVDIVKEALSGLIDGRNTDQNAMMQRLQRFQAFMDDINQIMNKTLDNDHQLNSHINDAVR